MKIVVFEYICGGGIVNEELPEKLKREGQLMLQALLNDLSEVSGIEVQVILDHRINTIKLPKNATVYPVHSTDHYQTILKNRLDQSTVFWPVAPETDGILYQLVALGKQMDNKVLASSPEVISLCSSKYDTLKHLYHQHISVAQTHTLSAFAAVNDQDYVIKPDDGIGAENIQVVKGSKLVDVDAENTNLIVQPRLDGDHLSLSCLCKEGQAWLLSVNRQLITRSDNSFEFTGCEVNISTVDDENMRCLINQVAMSMPGLWGYIGIDLIITPQGELVVMEINPRLTTSYAGIKKATGMNVSALVLGMLDNDPRPMNSQNNTIRIEI